jgi:hypothetical protein
MNKAPKTITPWWESNPGSSVLGAEKSGQMLAGCFIVGVLFTVDTS